MSSNGRGHEDHTRIVLRPIGSGLPLGFFSFGIGMLLLACQADAVIPVAEQKSVGMTLIAFVAPLELLATIFAFLARDTLGATTLGLFAASWLTFGWSELASPPGSTSVTLGIYMFGFSAAIVLLAGLSALGKPFFTVLLLFSVVRQLLSGIYEAGGSHRLYTVSGWIAFALSAVAMYGGLALGLEDARQKEVLPLFRRGGADEAFQGYEAQLARLEAEPGVRQQL
ncbi:MAG TPA: GPR1/FUN34/YaaH family transporter [Gaiellaceae bacterium]|nr:GPR1/FUN34/YaaH family transporter [Gaiellaceae bacterium]